MAAENSITSETLEALRRFDTCMIANAIETFDVRLRNAGYTDSSIHCMFKDRTPMVGYAATARLRASEPPIVGSGFREPSELWSSILQIPAPRVLVLEDMDRPSGCGAFVGAMHAAILKALHCIGYVTNGAVRELPTIREMDFQLFAAGTTVSHAYSHVFEIGAIVRVGGLEVRPGELLHGGRDGVLAVPATIASRIPAIAAEMQEAERRVIDFCRSPDFSVGKLGEVMKAV